MSTARTKRTTEAPASSQSSKKRKLDSREVFSASTANANGGRGCSTHPTTSRKGVSGLLAFFAARPFPSEGWLHS